jgi:lipopolysaccharide export system protein LptC
MSPLRLHLSSEESRETGMTRLVRSDEETARTSAKSRHHSSLVRKLRLLLPLAALAIVVVMFSWSDMDKISAPVPREKISPQTVGKNELLSPKFQSEDSSRQPYTITAEKAFQKSENLDQVILDKPVADINLKDGTWVALEAVGGEFSQSSGNLILDGQVKIFHDSGYELHTEHMNIDIKNETLSSTKPVTGHGPGADIEASGLTGTGDNKTLIFTGPAKLTLRPAPQDSPSSSSPRPPSRSAKP